MSTTEIVTKKIILIGLDNAGKTSILKNWKQGPAIDPLETIQPTKLVKISQMEIKGYKCIIWDFGGQTSFREQYFNKINYYFSYADIVLYVIDVQDQDRYELALNYLLDIIKVIKIQKLLPKFAIYIHKYDPKLMYLEAYETLYRNLRKRINKLFENEKIEYKIFKTSIYNNIPIDDLF